MPQRDVVVIGGSAGSLSPLREILSGLPAGFPASIFVALHIAEDTPAFLDHLLSKASPLPAIYPVDQEPIRLSRIYLARADHHLTLEDGRMRVRRGPRENRHRPAIDPLFRTAARDRGDRVIGVILSGLDDDGAAGLFAVKQRGGVAIVQNPRDAAARTMPESALDYASPHHILRAADIAPSIIRLVSPGQDETAMPNKKSQRKKGHKQASIAYEKPDANRAAAYFDEGEGIPSVFACPECHGVLWQLKDGNLVRFRCRVGHSFGMQSLTKELSRAAEGALWAAMRALEEKSAMQRRAADGLGENSRAARHLRDQASADEASARLIREMIFRRDQKLETNEPMPGRAA